jgi:hypothetical protein
MLLEGRTDPLAELLELPMDVDGAVPLVPAEMAPILPEEFPSLDLLLDGTDHLVGMGIDEQGIGRAVGLAEEACLAILLPSDHRRFARYRIEDVGGTHRHALVALDAAGLGQDLDHKALLERIG